jgi:hypothetical protein
METVVVEWEGEMDRMMGMERKGDSTAFASS